MHSKCPVALVASTAPAPRHVSVEFVADVVCPWCYIGFKRLEKAAKLVAEQEDISVDATFTPYILRRHLPKEGVDKLEMFAASGMGEASARTKFEHIKQTALDDDLCFDFEQQRAGNSEDAHRLLMWAARKHGGPGWSSLILQMFEQYNCHRGWLGSTAVLMTAVEGTGKLPAEEAAAVLADEAAYIDELGDGLERSARLGAQGVPLFVVDGTTTLPGAVATAELVAAIRAAADEPRRLAQWYVDRANAHDLVGLASMLDENVEMFGGPCDLAGLEQFFASYPQVQWNVTSEYKLATGGGSRGGGETAVAFEYRRTWLGADGKRLFVDAAEAITFSPAGKVVRIAYTREPSEASAA